MMRKKIAQLYGKWSGADASGSRAYEFSDAVLDAMRDPLDDMARAGRDKIILQSNYRHYPASHEIADVWRAMIDAAKEPQK